MNTAHQVTVARGTAEAQCTCGWAYLPATADTIAEQTREATYAGFDHLGDWTDVPADPKPWPVSPLAVLSVAVMASAATIIEPRAFPLIAVWVGLVLWILKSDPGGSEET